MAFEVESESASEEIYNEIPVQHLFQVSGLTVLNSCASRSDFQERSRDLCNEQPANFELAVAATGFGKFNIGLFFCTLPAFWSAVSGATSVSYAFARVKCYTQLSLLDKGTFSAITYGGMIPSALICGYLSDRLGRRRLMLWGSLATVAVELASAFNQNYAVMLVTRFLAGALVVGPFAVLIVYIAELHSAERRSKVLLYAFLVHSLAGSGLALSAWAMMAEDWYFEIFGVIRSYHAYMVTSAVMPLVTVVAFALLPESPIFLMSVGRNDEALWIFQRMYASNNNKNPEDYPIRKLVEYSQNSRAAALRGGLNQGTLFKLPHMQWLVLVCFIHFGAMFGSNTLRLWIPQLTAIIENKDGNICNSISVHTQPPPLLAEELETCVPVHADTTTYTQSVAVAAVSLITYSIAGFLVDRCGKKVVAGGCMLVSATTCALLPVFGTTSTAVSAIAVIFMAFAGLASGALNSNVVDLFPTSIRVVSVAVYLLMGRLGTICGNVAFPSLLALGCLPPFLVVTFLMAVGGMLSFLMPKAAFKHEQ